MRRAGYRASKEMTLSELCEMLIKPNQPKPETTMHGIE
jgi:hypothetical protein